MHTCIFIGFLTRSFTCIRQYETSCHASGAVAIDKRPADFYFVDSGPDAGKTKYGVSLARSAESIAAISSIYKAVLIRSVSEKLEALQVDRKFPSGIVRECSMDLETAIDTRNLPSPQGTDVFPTFALKSSMALSKVDDERASNQQALEEEVNRYLKEKFSAQINQKINDLIKDKVQDDERIPDPALFSTLALQILDVIAIESFTQKQLKQLQEGITFAYIDGTRKVQEVLNADVETGHHFIALEDKRQLYSNNGGWVGVAQSGNHSNNDIKRRLWYIEKGEKGEIFTLLDGSQLYTNRDGWVGVAQEGEHSNTDLARRTWISRKWEHSLSLAAPSSNGTRKQLCLTSDGWLKTNCDALPWERDSPTEVHRWIFTAVDLEIGDRLRDLDPKYGYAHNDVAIVTDLPVVGGEAKLKLLSERTGLSITIGRYDWLGTFRFEERITKVQVGDKIRPLPDETGMATFYRNAPVYTVTEVGERSIAYKSDEDSVAFSHTGQVAQMWSLALKRERLESEMYHFVERAFDEKAMKHICETMKKVNEERGFTPDSTEAKTSLRSVVTYLVLEECKRELGDLMDRYDKGMLFDDRHLYILDLYQNAGKLLATLKKPLSFFDESRGWTEDDFLLETAERVRLRRLARAILQQARGLATC